MTTFDDVDAAEQAAAEFLWRLDDLVEEYNQIAAEMFELGRQLSTPLDFHDGETYGDFMHRHGAETPQALIAGLACRLICAREDDLHLTVRMLDYGLAEILKHKPAAPPAPPRRPKKKPLTRADWRR